MHIAAQKYANCSDQGFKCLAMHISWDRQPNNSLKFWSNQFSSILKLRTEGFHCYAKTILMGCVLESWAGQVNRRELWGGYENLHCFAYGCVLNFLWDRVGVGYVGVGQVRVDKYFVWVTKCWAKAHELNQLKNHKTCGCTVLKLFASIALRTVGLQQLLHYYVTTHCATLAQTLAMWWASDQFPMLPSYLVRNNSV